MNSEQQKENLRMLASIVGITDDEASERLKASIQITWLPDDQIGQSLGELQ